MDLTGYIQDQDVAFQRLTDIERLSSELAGMLHKPCTMVVLERIRIGSSGPLRRPTARHRSQR